MHPRTVTCGVERPGFAAIFEPILTADLAKCTEGQNWLRLYCCVEEEFVKPVEKLLENCVTMSEQRIGRAIQNVTRICANLEESNRNDEMPLNAKLLLSNFPASEGEA